MKTFVISLDSAKDRRATLEERLAVGGIYDFEVWDAFEPHPDNDRIIRKMTNRDWIHDPRLKNMTKNEARKATYLSHMKLLAFCINKGINECLILEDDIVFTDDITDILYKQPKDSLMTFLDTTHIEGKPNPNARWDGNYLLLKDSGVRAWCVGCVYINNISKVYYNLAICNPKVYDACLISYIQKRFNTYVYMDRENKKKRLAYQDRKTFKSSIC